LFLHAVFGVIFVCSSVWFYMSVFLSIQPFHKCWFFLPYLSKVILCDIFPEKGKLVIISSQNLLFHSKYLYCSCHWCILSLNMSSQMYVRLMCIHDLQFWPESKGKTQPKQMANKISYSQKTISFLLNQNFKMTSDLLVKEFCNSMSTQVWLPSQLLSINELNIKCKLMMLYKLLNWYSNKRVRNIVGYFVAHIVYYFVITDFEYQAVV
jgi:hypothetical protein